VTDTTLAIYSYEAWPWEPFVFRIVEAQADPLGSGGFWSTSFYVTKADEVANLMSSLGLPQGSTPTSTLVSSTRTSSIPAYRTASTSQPPPTSLTLLTTTMPSNPSEITTASTLEAGPTSAKQSNKKTIGLAVGLTVGVVIILGVVGLLVWRRQRKVAERKKATAPSSTEATSETQEYTPLPGRTDDLSGPRDSAQTVEHQDEWVRDRT